MGEPLDRLCCIGTWNAHLEEIDMLWEITKQIESAWPVQGHFNGEMDNRIKFANREAIAAH